ncbi:MAG: biotin--[acetyl-CoA-carboxylase] ligase [Comamonadaceae bacterium]|nr:biotin--[acetyl-CoA-carboxylase] ligase [Comamonadaceae bacterium]
MPGSRFIASAAAATGWPNRSCRCRPGRSARNSPAAGCRSCSRSWTRPIPPVSSCCAPAGEQHGARVCLAETQTAGRGRRGRGWVATPFHGLLLSVGWRFESGPAVLSGLSLAAGVAVLRALDAFGVPRAGLKWPNDVLIDGRKLAGLLVDLRGEAAGPSFAVLGLGLNVHIAAAAAAFIDQPWTSLREWLPAPVDRNRLAALLIGELTAMLVEFERSGFAAFGAAWERHHVFAGQPVRVRHAHGDAVGVAVGIDEHGALQLRDPSGAVRALHSGDVSLRAAS